MSGTLPFDLTALAAGAVRVIVHPITTAIFHNPSGAFLQVAPYTPTTGGVDLGATTGPATYDRNLTVQSYKIEQSTAVVLETPLESIRQIHIPMGQLTPANIGMFENSAAIGTVAAATGHSAFATLAAGDVTDLTAYRVTIVGMRQKSQGLVTETGGVTTRGRFYGLIAFRATMTADNGTVSFGANALASMTVTLKLYPEPGEVQGQDQVIWFDEAAGLIT